MLCVLHYYYCIFQENELSTGNDLVQVKEAARLTSLASFLQPPACKSEILHDHRKEQVFTQVLYQPANRSTCVLHILVLLGLLEATNTGTWQRPAHRAAPGRDGIWSSSTVLSPNCIRGLWLGQWCFSHIHLFKEKHPLKQIKVNNEYFLKEVCR